MALRPSPTVSATYFPANTRRKGNDGRMYTVKLTYAGVHRWVPVASSPPMKSLSMKSISMVMRQIARQTTSKPRTPKARKGAMVTAANLKLNHTYMLETSNRPGDWEQVTYAGMRNGHKLLINAHGEEYDVYKYGNKWVIGGGADTMRFKPM